MEGSISSFKRTQQKELLPKIGPLYDWLEDNNFLLSEDDIRTMFLEGYDDLEGFSIQETSVIPFASSWMDAELDRTRSRSRLWPYPKDTTTQSDLTSDTFNPLNVIKFELDEYCETDLEADTMESRIQEVDKENTNDLQDSKQFSKKKRRHENKQNNKQEYIEGEKNIKFNQSFQQNITTTDLKHDTVGISHYLLFCSMNQVTPIRSVVNSLSKQKLALQYRGLGTLEIKLITKALRVLSECKLRKDGLFELYDTFIKNVYIKRLDLSGCELGDASCSMLAEILKMNRVLQYLNLARNQFSSDGAELLGDAISSNDNLYEINLSWNSITGPGALCIARGLKENIRIKICDLSWNGYAGKSGLEIAQVIKENTSLTELNLQYNRISDAEIEAISQAICIASESNETKLSLLNVSSNPISTKGMLNFFKQLNKAQSIKMKTLMLEDIPVNFDCLQLIDSLNINFPELCITHGPQLIVGNTQDDIQSKAGTFVDLLFLLKSQINYNGKIFTDLLQQFDVDKRGTVTVSQFMEALKLIGVNYKREQIIDLQQRLDRYADGTIYYKDYLNKQTDTIDVIHSKSS
ncbi:unnamed protein product [Heterobilharzia americana]|nr:unnamed protein product [Heterobilharzia americana]